MKRVKNKKIEQSKKESAFVSMMQNGGFSAGNFSVPSNIGFTQTTPSFQPLATTPKFENYAQNNPLPMYNSNGFAYNPNTIDPNNTPSMGLKTLQQNPYSSASEEGSGYQTDQFRNNVNEKFQFFNPYAGGNAYTGAYGLGESIERGDTLGIIGSGLQTTLPLLRTGFAGAGNARREQYVMQDAMEKYREGLKPAPQSMQQGGLLRTSVPRSDYEQYRAMAKQGVSSGRDVATVGIPSRSDYEQYRAMGVQGSTLDQEIALYQVPPRSDYEQYRAMAVNGSTLDAEKANPVVTQAQYNMARNPPLNYVNAAQIPSNNNKLGYNTVQKQNLGGYNQLAQYQEGGQVPQQDPQQLMQQVVEAIQQGADPNQIIEQLIQRGVPHSDAMGIVEAVMQQLQVAPEQQSEILQEQESFEMGGIKKKSLPKLLTGEYTAEKDNISEDEVVAELEKNEWIKRPDGGITQVLGNSHENGGAELTEEQLPENSKILSDHLKPTKDFIKNLKDLGVSNKDTYAKVLEKWTVKSGLKKIIDEQEELIKQLEAQTKLAVDKPASKNTVELNTKLLQSKISELEKQKEPLDTERSSVFEVLFSEQEASKSQENDNQVMQQGGVFNGDIIVKYAKKHGITPERANELVNEYKNGGVAKYEDGGRFEDFYKQNQRLGYKGKKQIGEMQKWLKENYPDEVVNYYTKSGQPLNASHVDIIKNKYKDTFAKAGIPENKASAEYADEEKLALQNALGEKANKDFYLDGFVDNKWDWRAPVLGVPTLTPAGMTQPVNQLPTAVNPFLNRDVVATTPATQPEKKDKFENLDNAQRVKTGIMNLPNQYAQLPDALQGALKLEYRPNLVENQNITADPIVAEIRRGEQSVMRSIQNLPDEQRAAATAQIQANTQEQINKVMSQVQGQNLQSNITVAGQNAQTLNQAQDINNRYLSDYENKIYKAQAITDADRRNYFAHNQKVDLANYNAINNANLLNQLTENYQITPNGIEFMNNPNLQYGNLNPAEYQKRVLAEVTRQKAEEKKVVKKAVAKNGGRFKKGN